LVAIMFLVAAPTLGQVESGTIIVVAESQAKVVVAADSRAIDGEWKARDNVDKITLLRPNLVFAATGVVMDNSSALTPDSRFVAVDVAREVVKNFKPDELDSQMGLSQTAQIALTWAWKMSFKMRQGIDKRLDVWLFGQKPVTGVEFLKGVFAGTEPDGSLAVVTAILDYAPARPGWITPLVRPYLETPGLSKDFTWIEPFGMKAIAFSYIHYGSSDFSKQIRSGMLRVDDFDERIPYDLVQRTIDDAEPLGPGKPKGVGGKIDLVELRPKGTATWLCRKSECTTPARTGVGK
jgi:hypothetical protein